MEKKKGTKVLSMNLYLAIPFLLYFSLKFVLEASNKITEHFKLEKTSKII